MSGARGDRGGTGRGAATGVGGPDPPGATGGIGEFFLFIFFFPRRIFSMGATRPSSSQLCPELPGSWSRSAWSSQSVRS